MEYIMSKRPPCVLMFLLVLLRVLGTTDACDCSASTTYCNCVGLNLTSVPQNLLTNTTRLFLKQNQITTLSQSDFSRYRSLKSLDLAYNHISVINSQAFHHLSSLTALWLIHNRLTSLRADMFTGLVKLDTLFIYNNDINDIQAGTFDSTPNLRSLYMYYNKLTTLRADMFTGLGNFKGLYLNNNDITDIQPGTFNQTPLLKNLFLNNNKLTSLKFDMFTGLGNVQGLTLDGNNIMNIQARTFNSTPQLVNLNLENNQIQSLPSNLLVNLLQLGSLKLSHNKMTMFPFEELSDVQTISFLYGHNNKLTTLPSMAYDVFSSISYVNIENNPWQCDCGMVPFKLKMTGSYPFEDQINCSQPDHLTGLKLKNVKLEKLFSECVEPTIVRFERDDSKVSVQGGNLQLVCEASGFPTPDITVIPPSGLNATAESGGRITVEVNGAITITRVTAADAGLYVCIASNPVGSTFAVFSTGVISSRSFPLPVFAGSLCGAVVGTLLIVAIVLTICKTCTRIRSEPPAADPNVVLSTLMPQSQGEGSSTSDD
ncbi:PREDICTED: chondroadherin-like [Branchiostoma belcheri]|uniref:Chondroadherin-like n=1 Tax=Branchiostoma belcheri TaxID=7741 RepID=A0A6P5A224_BRABE|nr:PREDICTED: chondroadherin-like [Branchiostoma belcheri]